MKYDLVIFDLDGTILDTLGDLTAACNHAMRAHGFPTHTAEEVRAFIGSGVANLIARALPPETSPEIHAAALADFKAHYAAHTHDLTSPYPGVPQLMRALRNAGIHVAVNSNKLDSATGELCRLYFDGLVERAIGERAGVPRKPAPDGVQELMSAFGAQKARTLYVGDSNIDLQTAQNAGIDCGWVSWGFRRRDELGDLTINHAFDDVEELRQFILD